MMNLATNLGGIKLNNPVIVAAGDIGCRLDQIEEAEYYGAGADIIDVGNAGIGVMPGLTDIYDPDKMGGGFVSAERNLALCLTGAPLKAISQAYLIRSARQVRTPILGCGGITDWKDVVETIMCGATATALCTAFMIHGFGIIKEITSGLTAFMKNQGYHSIDEFKGLFSRKVALNPSEINVHEAVALVDPDKCNGCGVCAKPAHCGFEKRAITLHNGKAAVDKKQCIGCETCASICPLNAITMVVKKQDDLR